MKFRPPPMQPAFSGTGHLAVWIVALAGILVSPILTALIVSPETRYLVMSKRVGPSDWHTDQVLKETGPLDILVLGNSRMLMAIDHAALHEDVHAADGPLKSETIAARFNGYDLSYTFLKDFFIHRHARLVVVNYPDIPQVDNHPGEKYIRTLGQPDPGLSPSAPALAVTNYAEMAMIGPRLALASLIRPGTITRTGYRTAEDYPDYGPTRGSFIPDDGYQENKTSPREPFARYDSPDKPQPAIIISSGAPLPPGVVLTDRPFTPIESAYLPAIKALCEKNGATLAFMLIPMANSEGPIEISSQVLALGVPIIAASSEMMFGNISADRIKENYYDHLHFNSNGARRSAAVFGPAFQTLLQKSKG
ncbi:MAG: hypothetical protein WA231_25210 [Methylocella sp.]